MRQRMVANAAPVRHKWNPCLGLTCMTQTLPDRRAKSAENHFSIIIFPIFHMLHKMKSWFMYQRVPERIYSHSGRLPNIQIPWLLNSVHCIGFQQDDWFGCRFWASFQSSGDVRSHHLRHKLHRLLRFSAQRISSMTGNQCDGEKRRLIEASKMLEKKQKSGVKWGKSDGVMIRKEKDFAWVHHWTTFPSRLLLS